MNINQVVGQFDHSVTAFEVLFFWESYWEWIASVRPALSELTGKRLQQTISHRTDACVGA